ncbi:GIY-YIG nuclease family protein [Streptomyces mutabilis]|uniref:GIY-YIG nuclease family protein n=1 Tax=Streptomyces mutabilis TaxID=67332 RepID=UPI0036C189DB
MPETPNADASVVYVIGELGSLTVKIGVAVDVKHRLANIQRMSPVPLKALWTHPGNRRLEKNLHIHFREYRSHGEWFTFPADPIPLIQDAVASEPWLQDADNINPPSSAIRAMDALRSQMRSFSDTQVRYRVMMELGEQFRAWEREQRKEIALALYAEGRTWRDVGQIMGGVSYQRAHQYAYGMPVQGKVVLK